MLSGLLIPSHLHMHTLHTHVHSCAHSCSHALTLMHWQCHTHMLTCTHRLPRTLTEGSPRRQRQNSTGVRAGPWEQTVWGHSGCVALSMR